MLLRIVRYAYTSMGTFGEIYLNGTRLVTVERPWLDNQRSISCIPLGNYTVKPGYYNRGGYKAMEVMNVPNRSNILFHRGNTMYDSAGCILITSREGCVNGMWAGLESTSAFNYFMSVTGSDSHQLEIVD
jgi:hypothetical protein